MKTVVLNYFWKVILAVTLINLFGQRAQAQAQPDLSFTTYTIVSGTDRQPGVVYRFSNVTTGVDALVKYTSSVNGAILDSVDQIGSGFLAGFQPLVRVPANTNGYISFQINFVVAGGNANATIPVFTHSGIDIDGHQLPGDSVYEWEAVNMGNNAQLRYSVSNPGITVTQQGNWITAKNTEAVEYAGIDTIARNVMFSVSNTNVSQYLLRVGVDNRSGSSTARQRSSYFKPFNYPGSTLPVKLASFTATLNNAKADLKWTTASEINVSHFVIERSLDGRTFTDVGIVFATGNSTDAVRYSFSDNLGSITAPVVYYRLRSVDIDARAEYSETRIIRLARVKENEVSILTYPNPVTNELRITVPSGWQNKPVVYEIYALNGQVARRVQTASSGQTQTVNVGTMAPGLYVVKVACEGIVAKQSIVKQ